MKAIGPLKILILATITSALALFSPNSSLRAADGAAEAEPIAILAFGDSLTAGYGLPAGEGFTDQLEVWLNEHSDKPIKVFNGGVSGDTSSGGRARLDWGMAPIKGGKPDLVILELGANDALRGVTPDITRANIEAMVKKLKDREIPVLIAGMLATPSWGEEYGKAFNSIYADMAAKYEVPLYPFFLDGVAADPSLNQSDGMHPNTEGVAIIVSKIGPKVLEVLSR
jgi:acyl-CoA thioesterase-1